MRPQGSIPIKVCVGFLRSCAEPRLHYHKEHEQQMSLQDYAIETPLKKSSSEGDMFYEVKIDLIPKRGIAAINFVLKVRFATVSI